MSFAYDSSKIEKRKKNLMNFQKKLWTFFKFVIFFGTNLHRSPSSGIRWANENLMRRFNLHISFPVSRHCQQLSPVRSSRKRHHFFGGCRGCGRRRLAIQTGHDGAAEDRFPVLQIQHHAQVGDGDRAGSFPPVEREVEVNQVAADARIMRHTRADPAPQPLHQVQRAERTVFRLGRFPSEGWLFDELTENGVLDEGIAVRLSRCEEKVQQIGIGEDFCRHLEKKPHFQNKRSMDHFQI